MAIYYADELEHHGIQGMKWGVRRFQNPDGSLTPEGRERYYGTKETGKFTERVNKLSTASGTDSFGRPVTTIYDLYGSNDGKVQRLMRTPQAKAIASGIREQWKNVSSLEKSMATTEAKVLNRNTIDDLGRKAAEQNWKQYGRRLEKDGWTKKTYTDSVLYEDAKYFFGKNNVSNTAGFQWWVRNSGDPKAKQYLADVKKYKAAYSEYQKECNSLLRQFFGNYVNATDTATVAKGQALMDEFMRRWDTYEQDWMNGKTVPVSKISKLLV